METFKHYLQMTVLIQTLMRYLEQHSRVAYVAGNNFLYYRRGRPPKFVGPDFYVVLGRANTYQKSYVVWEEGDRFPDVIIELISESTEHVDRGRKFELYQNVFRTPEYFLFNPISLDFNGFRLEGDRYEPIKPDSLGRWRSQVLGLDLKVDKDWLRWYEPQGLRLPTGDELARQAEEWAEQERERAEQERERAEQERERAEQERRRAAALAARLRELGVDPDQVDR